MEARLKYNKQKMKRAVDTCVNEPSSDDDDQEFENDKKKIATTLKRGVNRCQAEKCSVDLTDAKPYHRRHKVCEHHAKAQMVLVAGIRQRFCQQCSRFHELSEFDEAKRSCRRRLAGHNERRRKNPTETTSNSQAEGSVTANRIKGTTAAQYQRNGLRAG